MTRAPVAVGDLAVVGAMTARVEAVTHRRVLLAGLGWATRTRYGAEHWGKLGRRTVITFRGAP